MKLEKFENKSYTIIESDISLSEKISALRKIIEQLQDILDKFDTKYQKINNYEESATSIFTAVTILSATLFSAQASKQDIESLAPQIAALSVLAGVAGISSLVVKKLKSTSLENKSEIKSLIDDLETVITKMNTNEESISKI